MPQMAFDGPDDPEKRVVRPLRSRCQRRTRRLALVGHRKGVTHRRRSLVHPALNRSPSYHRQGLGCCRFALSVELHLEKLCAGH